MTKNRALITFLSHLSKTDSHKGHLAAQFILDFQIKRLLYDSGGRNHRSQTWRSSQMRHQS